MELETYTETILRMMRERKGTPVLNGSPDHAAVIIENLFHVAHHDICLLSGDLNSRVYGTAGVVQRAREFLGHSDHRLRVLLEKDTFSNTHPLVEEMIDAENAELRLLQKTVSDKLKFHFMAADQDCFRFEPEKDKHVAVAAFGDVETTSHLRDVFETMWEEANPIQLVAH